MRRFEFVDGGSSKFWSIAQEGSAVRVQFGRIGSTGQTQVKSFANDAAAQKEMESLVRSKLGKGYVEVAQPEMTAPAAAPPAAKAQPVARPPAAKGKPATVAPPSKAQSAATPRAPKGKPAAAPPAMKAKQPAASAPMPTEPPAVSSDGICWLAADKGYQLGLVDGKLTAKNSSGKVLASVPKELKSSRLGEELCTLQEWLDEHELGCLAEVEQWLLKSFSVPAKLLQAIWPDPAWRSACENLVVEGIQRGEPLEASRGFLRGVDPKRGFGVVTLDGETVWSKADGLMFLHPILLDDLDDYRGLSSELGLVQKVQQLYRETHAKPRDLGDVLSKIDSYAGGEFEMLAQAQGLCKKHGFAVRGGAAVSRVWEGGALTEARYWIGCDDPSGETVTEDLIWVDEKERTLPVRAVGKVAFSEGMRMASLVYAGRKVERESGDD